MNQVYTTQPDRSHHVEKDPWLCMSRRTIEDDDAYCRSCCRSEVRKPWSQRWWDTQCARIYPPDGPQGERAIWHRPAVLGVAAWTCCAIFRLSHQKMGMVEEVVANVRPDEASGTSASSVLARTMPWNSPSVPHRYQEPKPPFAPPVPRDPYSFPALWSRKNCRQRQRNNASSFPTSCRKNSSACDRV